ncbi:MAG: ATP-binding cassette domain-containing protein [Desulfosalsimonadaceae bacterium]
MEEKVFEVRELTMQFYGLTALDSISTTVSAGEFVGIVGTNGSGKTTFVNVMTGYLSPTSGSVKVLGREIKGLYPYHLTKMGVSRSFQIAQLFQDLTVEENMLFALAARENVDKKIRMPLKSKDFLKEAGELLDLFKLGARKENKASELPAGDRKVLDIAMAFGLKPTLLFLDEPTSGVSTEEKFQVMETLVQALQTRGVTVVFIEHDLEIVKKFAQRVLDFDEGKIIADGLPEDVLEG